MSLPGLQHLQHHRLVCSFNEGGIYTPGVNQGIAHDKPEQVGNAVNSRGLIPRPQLSSSQRGARA